MKNNILLTLFLMFSLTIFSQKNIFLDVAPMFQNSNLEMNTSYSAWNGKTFKLDHFDYYLSNVQLTHDGGQTILIDSVFLVEPQNHTLLLGDFNINQIENISFLIGVPKPLNTQFGIQAKDISLYPENHPLSFQTPSMYWGWQAGYMHMIIGGYADDNSDGSLESYFELHNLGNANQQTIQLNNVIQTNLSSDQINVNILCQVDRWINNIPISTVGIMHDEVGVNKTILENAITENVFIQPANAGIDNLGPSSRIYFSSYPDGINIHWNEIADLEKMNVYDINGKQITQVLLTNPSGQFMIDNLEKGYYIIQFFNKNSILIGSLNAVH